MIDFLNPQLKMVREVIKVSFLLVILIQFQTGSYNFLHAQKQVISVKPASSNNSLNHDLEMNLDDLDSMLEISKKMDHHETIMFEQKLLELVGLKKRPVKDREKATKIPKYLVQLYKDQIKSDIPTSNLNLPGRLTRTANTIRSFYNSGNEADLVGGNTHLRFDLSSIPDHELITGAELRVPFSWHKNKEKENMKSQSVQILVHDIVKIPTRPNTKQQKHNSLLLEPISYPVDSKSMKFIDDSTSYWLTFDVFPAAGRWSKNRNKSLALAIEMTGKNLMKTDQELPKVVQNQNKNSRLKRSLDDLDSSEEQSPMLLIYSDDGKNPRKTWDAKTLSRHYRSVQNLRRRRNHRHKNRRRNLCSRKKMFVDFTDVGWNDWIVAPPGYQAYYCSGECPFPMADHLNATNHAVIQALVNSMNPRLVPPPCCVPNKYTSLSLLYTDSSDRIVLKNYNDMIVDSCGCS